LAAAQVPSENRIICGFICCFPSYRLIICIALYIGCYTLSIWRLEIIVPKRHPFFFIS
jgi:hypothetical protein